MSYRDCEVGPIDLILYALQGVVCDLEDSVRPDDHADRIVLKGTLNSPRDGKGLNGRYDEEPDFLAESPNQRVSLKETPSKFASDGPVNRRMSLSDSVECRFRNLERNDLGGGYDTGRSSLSRLNRRHFTHMVAWATVSDQSPIHNDVADASNQKVDVVIVSSLLDQHGSSGTTYNHASGHEGFYKIKLALNELC